MRRSSARLVGAAPALLLLAAAQQPMLAQDTTRTRPSRVEVRDVRYASSDSAVSRWRLSARPLVTVGGATGSGPTEFSGVAGLVRLDDGRIIIADGGSSELRAFDSAGRFLMRVARRGRGPGEMRGVEGLLLAADTLYALDEHGGAHLFTVDGSFVRLDRYTMGPSASFGGRALGVLAGSGLVGVQRARAWGTSRVGLDSQQVRVQRPGERSPTVIAVLPHQRTFQHVGDSYPRPFAFATSLQLAVFPREVCAAFTERYESRCLDARGAPTRTIRRAVGARPVSDSMKRAWRDGMAGRLPDGGSRWEGSLRAHRERVARTSEFMPTLPLISRLLSARTGELWVADYQPSDDILSLAASALGYTPTGPTRWNIFGRDSEWLDTLTLPPRFVLVDPGRDWVAGVARDDDDVERVEVWWVVRR